MRSSAIEVITLKVAEVVLPDSHPEGPGTCKVFAFLVCDGEAYILVDTGVGHGSIVIEELYKPRRADLASKLDRLGVPPHRITAVVNSHLHFDHCGNNRLFANIPIFVQRDEYEAARENRYTVRDWVDFPGANYVLLDGSRYVSEHVEVVPTPGHTPGHQSVVVHSKNATDLIVAQAAYTMSEFESLGTAAGVVPEGTWSPEAYAASLASLHRLNSKRVFFSHDDAI